MSSKSANTDSLPTEDVARPRRPTGANLGTFAGVFTPSILTILGIILFLRTGYVVGNAGLAGALVIIAMATAVSVLTSISLAAIATNIDVRGGGDYYLISRTLGREFGGAIGIVLFLAQSISIAFYAIGFGEATTTMLVLDFPYATQLIAAAAILLALALLVPLASPRRALPDEAYAAPTDPLFEEPFSADQSPSERMDRIVAARTRGYFAALAEAP